MTEAYYAVKIKSNGALAIGLQPPCAIFYQRRQAVEFVRGLADHDIKGKVVKVLVTVEEVTK